MRNHTCLHRVVIIGGGFGGVCAARSLKRAPARVALLDRRNYHLFQPLLYQVATGALSPANIAAPLRTILKKQKNTQVLMAEVTDFAVASREVILSDGKLPYDSLIVATGSSHHYYGHDEWADRAPGLKTIDDATEIRRRILLAFEAAEREPDSTQREALMTFVVVGAGPTGVELAGALSEIAKDTLKCDFRAINPAEARIFLLEGTDRVLPPYPAELSAAAKASLEAMGVSVKTKVMVTDITPERVTYKSGANFESIAVRTVLWAAGVKASPLGARLAETCNVPVDPIGRVIVTPDLTVPNHPDIFVIGDLAHLKAENGQALPGVAQVAIQQGEYVARVIRQRLRGEPVPPPFRYRDYGSMATIGRARAVADLKGLHLSGFFAWLAWLFIHLLYIVRMENRLLVLLQWAWNYFSRNRSARLITGENPLPFRKDPT